MSISVFLIGLVENVRNEHDHHQEQIISQYYYSKLCKKMRDRSIHLRKGFGATFESIYSIDFIHDDENRNNTNHSTLDSSTNPSSEYSPMKLSPYVIRICYTSHLILVGNSDKEFHSIEFFDLNTKKHLHSFAIESVPFYLCVEENDVFCSGQKSRRVLRDEPCFLFSEDSYIWKYKLKNIQIHFGKQGKDSSSSTTTTTCEWKQEIQNATSLAIQYSKDHDPYQNLLYICSGLSIHVLNSVSGQLLATMDMSSSLTSNIICLEVLEASEELILFSRDRFYRMSKKMSMISIAGPLPRNLVINQTTLMLSIFHMIE
ncbi:hypothetical protein FDP41_011034 [Naegleria fowleri]|uniref:CNH domain-containing protein n=1 Tax=Naegleria fowleri TaxID=5763 RepID=A0A6A5C5M1_NAEFO|nr:uncharacterized protein FDP41_011034 [Naegleria fowleri]KAF0983056.1 hypothetical protein FDP41_011034 [Naegleria fowleri]